MRFPWSSRIAQAKDEASEAKRGYEETVAQREDVLAVAMRLQRHRVTNGWTEKVATIFGGNL